MLAKTIPLPMRVSKAQRDGLRVSARQRDSYSYNGDVTIESLVVVDLLTDVEELHGFIATLAAELRRELSAEQTPHEQLAHAAALLERLAVEIGQ